MIGIPKKRKAPDYTGIAPYMGLGTQLAISIIALFFLGYWLDSKFNSLPIFTIIFSFIGGFGGIYNFIKSVIQINDNKKKNIDSQ
ncbi:MAG: AtpZ/AtpI family protein [Bacteroidetes bacterium]|nr:AtpZ/AtpI family protein [Bacteroidota bacterium]